MAELNKDDWKTFADSSRFLITMLGEDTRYIWVAGYSNIGTKVELGGSMFHLVWKAMKLMKDNDVRWVIDSPIQKRMVNMGLVIELNEIDREGRVK